MRIDSTAMNDDITTSLRGLNKLAKILKRRRIEKGYISKIFLKYLNLGFFFNDWKLYRSGLPKDLIASGRYMSLSYYIIGFV